MSLKEKLWAGRCALPAHLKDRLHNDWVWPFSRIPRAYSAYGPRCPGSSPRHLPWPPRLIQGFDATRWEWCDEQSAVTGFRREVTIPDFEKRLIGPEVYREKWGAYEGDELKLIDLKDGWWPSIIPTTSEYGWLRLNPEFECRWRTTPSLKKFYWRSGFRPDFDYYYNKSRFYIGRNPE